MDDDDLRESLGVSSAYHEEEPEPPVVAAPPVRVARAGNGLILGMTAPQRFAISSMLFLLTLILGTLLLVLSNKIVFPF